MFVSLSCRAALLLPKDVSTLAKMLVMRVIPVFICTLMRTTIHLPKQVGALSNDLIQTSLRLGQNVPIVPKRFQWPTPTGMHPGGQLLEYPHRAPVAHGRQLLVLSLCIVSFGITSPAERLMVIGNVCRTVLLLPDTSTKRSGIAQILLLIAIFNL